MSALKQSVWELGPDKRGRSLQITGSSITQTMITKDADLGSSEVIYRPGRVCAHTHLYSGLVPFDMPAPAITPRNFPEILEQVWWKLDRALDASIVRAGARYYVAQSLLAGTTSLIDHHESPNLIEGSLDVLADACAELGIRAALCYGATERNGGEEEGLRGLQECARFIEERDGPTTRGFLGLHASFTVSNAVIERASALCQDLGAKMHVHVAEDIADLTDAKSRGFAGPLERLMKLGALPKGSIAVHGVHLDQEQIKSADAAGIWFVQNPRSNEGNAVGYPKALWATNRVALGTDGYPADMLEEQKALLRIGGAEGEQREALVSRLLAGQGLVAQIFGASASGLQEGGLADLVVEREGRVQDVIVDGNFAVKDGVLVHAELEELRREAQEAAKRLWKRMESL